MSAFVVSAETLQRCVSALHQPTQPCEVADDLGRQLIRLNIQAVRHRYPDMGPLEMPGTTWSDSQIEEWTWRVEERTPPGGFGPCDTALACWRVKALSCLRYQMTEGDDVPKTDLYAQIEKMIHELHASIVATIPAYRDASWD